MKKIMTFILLSVFLFACAKEKETLNIGVILPLTGSAAVWGVNAKMGIDLALSEFEMEGVSIKLFVEDSKSETKFAVSAFEKLINTDGLHVVIGDIASSSVLAMAPLAEKNKVVLLSPGASNPNISDAGDYVFRNWQSDALEGKIDAEFALNNLKMKNIAVLYVNNAYGTGLKKSFVSRLNELGVKILIEESFEQGATDVRTQLQKVKKANPDLLYIPGYPNEMAIALKQIKEIGLKTQILSTQAFDDPKIIEIVGFAANGVIFSVPNKPDSSNIIVKNFILNYKRMFNKEPGVCSDTGYDALKIIIWAMKEKRAKNGEEIKTALYSMSNFKGAAGETTFDKNGDVLRNFMFKTVTNKVIVNYE